MHKLLAAKQYESAGQVVEPQVQVASVGVSPFKSQQVVASVVESCTSKAQIRIVIR